MSPLFVFSMDIFTWGIWFRRDVFLTGNSCSLLLAILPPAAAGDNDGRVWIQMRKNGGGGGEK